MAERKPINLGYILFGIVLSICVLMQSYSYYSEVQIKVEQSKTQEQKQAEKRANFKQDSIDNVCQLAKEKCEWCEKHNSKSMPKLAGALFIIIALLVVWLIIYSILNLELP